MLLIRFLVKNENTAANINVLLLILLFIFVVSYRNTVLRYKDLSGVSRVFLKRGEAVSINNKIKPNIYFKNQKYILYEEKKDYEIFYEYKLGNSKIFKKNKINTVIILKDNNLGFYETEIHDRINELILELTKAKGIIRQNILIIKEYDNINNKDLEDINQVVSYTSGKNRFTQINLGLNKKDNKAYFLYNTNYMPTQEYQEIITIINEMIK